jgi:hypothetical protein
MTDAEKKDPQSRVLQFLDELGKPDDYGIWGSAERPENPITVGDLRALAAGPTSEDRPAGLAASINTTITGALRLLARKHLGEMDHAHLPMPDGDAVPIVTTAEVQSFLEGWATRIENGAEL